jgi:hypothetical protein
MKFAYWKTLNRIGLGITLGIVSGGLTDIQALPPDVGIITQLSGGVTYRNEEYQKKTGKAQAFMKIFQGDYFHLEGKAMAQLLYFQNGRQETWKGPVAFTVGELESQLKSEKGIQAQPEVKILPSGVLKGVQRVPVLLRRAGLSRSGIMQVRDPGGSLQGSKVSNEEKRVEIETAKRDYRNLRNQTKDNDLTPELYLLGILANYDQFEEMEKVIREAMKRQPDVEDLKKLKEWVKSQKAEPEKK